MPVSLDRMIENALDWEHLPWLHSSSFASIELINEDEWHWRATAELAGAGGGTLLLELRLHDDRLGWTTRTLEGAGAGTSIVTRVAVHGERELEVIVDFVIPGLETDNEAKVMGEFYLGLYQQLYDEDEYMMVERQRRLDDEGNGRPSKPTPIDLGPAEQLHERLPMVMNTDAGRFRVVSHDGRLLAHSTSCPHLLGPLDDCVLADSDNVDPEIECPWHGYRFSATTGRSTDGRRCRLAAAPGVETGNDGRVRLVWPANKEKTP